MIDRKTKVRSATSYDTLQEAIEANKSWDSSIISVRHIEEYAGRFYLMGHINCEYCKYCEEANLKNMILDNNCFLTGPHAFLNVIYDE